MITLFLFYIFLNGFEVGYLFINLCIYSSILTRITENPLSVLLIAIPDNDNICNLYKFAPKIYPWTTESIFSTAPSPLQWYIYG